MKSRFRFLSLLSRFGKQKHASGSGFLARLIRDEDGSYLLYMTVAIPVFIGFAGFASEGSLLLYNHRTLQSAADAAAYSAAVAYTKGDTGNAALTTQAEAIVAEYVKTSGWVIGTGNDQVNVIVRDPLSSGTPILNPYDNVAGLKAIEVKLSRPQLPILSSLWLKNPISVGGRAIAIISGGSGGGGGSGNCLLALGKTATGNNAPDAIHVNGGGNAVNINVPGCGVYVDSTDCTNGSFSVELGGNAKVNAGSLGSAGCIDVFGNANVTLSNGNYTQNGPVVPDPYAGTTVPTTGSAGSCTGNVCSPGVYTNLNLSGGGTYTLQPGVYILQSSGNQPAFEVGPGKATTVNGTGVTLVFANSYASGNNKPDMAIDSNATVNLTAPTTGPTNGFVMMGDGTMPLGTSFTTAANATVSMTGTMYLPNAALSWHGNPGTGSNQCLRAVANTILLNGDSGFSNVDCNNLFGGAGGGTPPPPPPLNVTLVN